MRGGPKFTPKGVQLEGALPTVAEMWHNYQSKVIPVTAPPIQIQECRRAFYSAIEGYYNVTVFGIGDPMNSEAAGEQYLRDIREELLEFGRKVQRREA